MYEELKHGYRSAGVKLRRQSPAAGTGQCQELHCLSVVGKAGGIPLSWGS